MKKNYQFSKTAKNENVTANSCSKKPLIKFIWANIILALLMLFVSYNLSAQFTKLHEFQVEENNSLKYPMYDNLIVKGSNLYGMTSSGGFYNLGGIFRISSDGSGYKEIFSFDGKNSGANPYGSLTLVGDSLYGMTNLGGFFNKGVIFKVDTSGNGFKKLCDLSADNFGANPSSSMILVGDSLYGTCANTTTGNGSIFKIGRNGTGGKKLFDFNPYSIGAAPFGSLTSSGDSLYGMTFFGGIGPGTIYKINRNGSGFHKILDFEWNNDKGALPNGSLTLVGDSLYGMNYNGGANGAGVLFKVHKNGTGFHKLLDFNKTETGGNPLGSLTLHGDSLYGMTTISSSIFKIHRNGTGYQKIFNFDKNNGNYPEGSLVILGSTLYGMTNNGGSSGKGVIFKIKANGTNFVKLKDFRVLPQGSAPNYLQMAGSSFIGTTTEGGTNGNGIMFKMNTDGTGYQKLFDFPDSVGVNQNCPLTLVGDSVYGVNKFSSGSIFKINKDGSGFQNLFKFVNTTGSYSYMPLTLVNDSLYGTTNVGAAKNNGGIFKINRNGSGYQKLFDFDYTNGGGYNPLGQLILIGDSLYGATQNGGGFSDGVLFKINKNGSGFQKIYSFDQIAGGRPTGFLTLLGDSIYGTTQDGGNNNGGVIYKIHRNGSGYKKLFDFDYLASGYSQTGPLYLLGNTLYGIIANGGANGYGTLFSINRNGKDFHKIIDFDYVNNGASFNSLSLFNGCFYGTGALGGSFGAGIILKYRPQSSEVQASSLQFSNIQKNQVDIKFTYGDGDKRAVFISQGNSGTPAIINGVSYNANSTFGLGSNDGSVWYCIANGLLYNTTITVTGLTANTTYRVMVVEYTGVASAVQYLTNANIGNPANVTTLISTQSPNLNSAEIEVYPIPATDKLYIKLPSDKSAIAELININGQIVLKKTLNRQLESLNVSGLAKGIYTLKIIAEDLLVVKKIEIQ